MFGRKSRSAPETFSAPVIRFIGEQDGEPERELKDHFSAIFKDNPTIQRAYLARVFYGDATEFNVCLCIKTTSDEDPSLVKTIGDAFAAVFRTEEHLDTVFIRDDQEAELRHVCAPFYAGA